MRFMVVVSLDAVILAVTDEAPRLAVVADDDGGLLLPSGDLLPRDRTLELAIRRILAEQSGLSVGYAEQLYTFGDAERDPASGLRLISVAYLLLAHEEPLTEPASWLDFYRLLPWEDHRDGRPGFIDEVIAPACRVWIEEVPSERAEREERAQVVFGLDGAGWDGVRVLERYELLYELGLLTEARDGGPVADLVSQPLGLDHRRMAATALGRLRGKLSYRPVVFELLPERFTLLGLQRLVEALAGVRLHKQNFRRLVESQGLVEGTGVMAQTGGRPAELFRFRREVLRERPRPGLGTPWSSVSA
jgi:hypothetical protein